MLGIFLLFTACSFPSSSQKTAFTAMDTAITGQFYGKDAKKAAQVLESQVTMLESLWSKTIGTSDISQLNQQKKRTRKQLDPRTQNLLSRAVGISQQTNGMFDPILGQLVSVWGIGTKEQKIPTQEQIETALHQSGLKCFADTKDGFALSKNAQLDVGGIAKGAATDEVAKQLEQLSLDGYLLSLGGNVYVSGNKPDKSTWKVGISDPDGKSGYIGYLQVSDCAVVTSGDYERFFIQDGIRYHHIFDPATGKPAQSGLRSVTVVSSDATLADALSTALFVMGREKGLAFCDTIPNVEAVFVGQDGVITLTSGLEHKFTLTDSERYTIKGKQS